MTGSAHQPLAVDDRGTALLSFTPGEETAPPNDAPVAASLVALWREDRILLVFDRYRQSWELPGGGVEEGESVRQAAVRELREESGQEPDGALRFAGFAKFVVAPDRRTEYLALFAGHGSEARDFRANEEISAIRWWDRTESLPGRVQTLDLYLAELTRWSSASGDGRGFPKEPASLRPPLRRTESPAGRPPW
ncbi:NUDIX hydrolase [Streptomyces sp. NPDC005227]|uniref:NUDIX hydrolase n=1 Tax=Streptomyces sp. NPDC005227 TaxID=3364707 RepID=UPI00369FADC8